MVDGRQVTAVWKCFLKPGSTVRSASPRQVTWSRKPCDVAWTLRGAARSLSERVRPEVTRPGLGVDRFLRVRSRRGAAAAGHHGHGLRRRVVAVNGGDVRDLALAQVAVAGAGDGRSR